jgi:hypothetical protein
MIELLVNKQRVELANDFEVLINKSIADIRNPETRSSDFTRTVEIPGTTNNNKVFHFIFDVANEITGLEFNPNKKADCIVLVDGMPQVEGFIRLTDIELNNGRVVYKCTIHGESANLFTDIENKKLNQLDFSEYNHICNINNIKDSWDNQIKVNGNNVSFAYGNGYVWTQVLPKRATLSTDYNDWKAADHTPALYAKTIVDKIFANAGYKYTSDSFFTSDRFKRLIVPYSNNALVTPPSGVTDRLFQAEVSGAVSVVSTGLTRPPLPFSNDSTNGNFDNGNNYNNTNYKYTVPTSGKYTFYLALKANRLTGEPNGWQQIAHFVVYNATQNKRNDLYFRSNFGAGFPSTQNIWDTTQSVTFNANINDEIYVYFENVRSEYDRSQQNANDLYYDIIVDSASYFYNGSNAATIEYNESVDFGFFFSDKFTQKDFLLSLVRMFNLYIEQTDTKTLRFVTRDEFYNGSNQDWSKLLNYDQAHEVVPMGDLQNNPYVFTYKEGTDYLSKEYKESTNRIYGDRTLRIDNDFVKSEKKIELTFSSTPVINIGNQYFSNCGDDKAKHTDDLRILYYNGLRSTGAYFLYDQTKPSQPNLLFYPVTTHMDDPYNMQFDLNYGIPLVTNLPLGFNYSNQNLVNVYYYKTIAEIIDKNSKIFRGYFHITPQTFSNLRFNSLYFFEGQYWRLNKVIDYNPQSNNLTKCEFLLANYYAPSKPNTKGVGVGGQDTDNAFNPDFYSFDGIPPIYNVKGTSGGLNSGDNVGSSDDAIVMGNNNANYGIFNTIFAGDGVTIPLTFDRVTTINCNDFEVPDPQRVYVENYPVVGAWLGSGKIVSITNTNSPYAAKYDDWLILCNTSGGNITVTLPTPTAANKGKMFIIKKTQAANQVTIVAGDGTINIDDSTTHTENAKNGYDQVVSDGTQYWIITHGH